MKPYWREMQDNNDRYQVTTFLAPDRSLEPEDYKILLGFDECYPTGLYVLVDTFVRGYLISYPLEEYKVPIRNTRLLRIPLDVTNYHIHGLVIGENYRRQKHGTEAVEIAKAQARLYGYKTVSVVCGVDSREFWRKQGFIIEVTTLGEAEKEILKSHGQEAVYLMAIL